MFKKVIDFLFSLIVTLLLVFAGLGAISNTYLIRDLIDRIDNHDTIYVYKYIDEK